jgi:hypothetical protein
VLLSSDVWFVSACLFGLLASLTRRRGLLLWSALSGSAAAELVGLPAATPPWLVLSGVSFRCFVRNWATLFVSMSGCAYRRGPFITVLVYRCVRFRL